MVRLRLVNGNPLSLVFTYFHHDHALRLNWKPTMTNGKVLLASTLIAMFLSLTIVTTCGEAASLSMPEEYIDYTITRVDDVLWAKIDGTYPISLTGEETSIPMVYPTPPGTTNISISLNDAGLEWNNFTLTTHHTAIGEWQEVSTFLEQVSGSFVLRIHYEHPLQVINGSYTFLYDLNILEYLSEAANRSVAHFTVRMETEYANLRVNTVFGAEETLKPIDFTASGGDPMEIKIDEVSEFNKPLPGDLLISFTDTEVPATPDHMLVAASALIAGFAAAGLVAYGLFRIRGRRKAHAGEG